MSLATLIPSRNVSLRLRDADRLFDEFWSDLGRFPRSLVAERPVRFVPYIDVSENEEAYVVRAELPGLEEKDFEVVLEEDVLTLKGEKHDRSESEEGGWRRSETAHGSFERHLRFPHAIEAGAVKARYQQGVLTVTLPKPEEARPQVRSIPVQTA